MSVLKGETMETVIDLLQEKNSYLEKFYSLNEDEIVKFIDGNFDGLDIFYHGRAAILEMIKSVDRRLEGSQVEVNEENEVAAEDKKIILNELAVKNDIVQRILAQDLQVLSLIENTKSTIIKELAKVRAVRKAVGTYSSRLDKIILDEEA